MIRNYSRVQYFERFSNVGNLSYQKKAFTKFDLFLESHSISEDIFIQKLDSLPEFEKYDILQKFVSFMTLSLSSGVTKKYFNIIFKYLIIYGLSLDYTKKKLLLNFPKVQTHMFDGLDEDKIKLLLHKSNDIEFVTYMATLLGSGMRETECLMLKPYMIFFDESPTRIKLDAEITKGNVERETFLPPLNSDRLKSLISGKPMSNHDCIFSFDLISAEKKFSSLRTKCNLDTINRRKHQQNDFTLHSFRSYFITELGDITGLGFAHALAGHDRYMKTYYRKPFNKRQEIFKNCQDILNF